MGNQQLVSKEVADRYASRMAVIITSGESAVESILDYWWNVWCVYRDKDFLAQGTLETWIATLSQAKYGPARITFFNKMRAIEDWAKLGMKESGIKHMLLNSKVATERDMAALWIDPTTGALKTEVKQAIEKGDETPVEALRRIAELPAGDARRELARMAGVTRSIYFSEPTLGRGQIAFTATVMDDGIMIEEYTLTAKSMKVKPKPSDKPEISGEVAQALAARLGLRL